MRLPLAQHTGGRVLRCRPFLMQYCLPLRARTSTGADCCTCTLAAAVENEHMRHLSQCTRPAAGTVHGARIRGGPVHLPDAPRRGGARQRPAQQAHQLVRPPCPHLRATQLWVFLRAVHVWLRQEGRVLHAHQVGRPPSCTIQLWVLLRLCMSGSAANDLRNKRINWCARPPAPPEQRSCGSS